MAAQSRLRSAKHQILPDCRARQFPVTPRAVALPLESRRRSAILSRRSASREVVRRVQQNGYCHSPHRDIECKAVYLRGGEFAMRSNLVVFWAMSSFISLAQSPGTFTATGNMTTARAFRTATLLQDGRVLITGGVRSGSGPEIALESAELYDPGSGTFQSTGDMTTGRKLHTATLLPDGRVLIAGGTGAGGEALTSTELYDPATGAFTHTGAMIAARAFHTAILLSNGRVMMVGGHSRSAYPYEAPAEMYDPDTGTFTSIGSYADKGGCDYCPPAILLTDGRVLLAGQNPVQTYDPISNSFRAVESKALDHSTAALLTSGKVVFAGGGDLGRSASADIYDAAIGTFTPTGSMAQRRVWHTLNLLADGEVLAAGGETDACSGFSCTFAGTVATAELYNPLTETFVATGNMTAAREGHTSTLLNDGRILMAGGIAYGGIDIFYGSLASAELYSPPVLTPPPTLLSVSVNGQAQAAIQHGVTYELVSPDNPAVAGESLIVYCTGLFDGGVIPPQVTIGGQLAKILWFGNTPGFLGLNQINVRVLNGVAPGPSIPVRMNYMGRLSNKVTMAVR